MKKVLLVVGLVFFTGSAFAARCVSGDCINGYGVYEFDSGNKYEGESKGGKAHGQGTFTFANGDKYVGEFKNNKRHGEGTFTFIDGAKYVGGQKNGKRDGIGTEFFPSGNKYFGEYKDDYRSGQGTFYHNDGRIDNGIWKKDIFIQANNKTVKPKEKQKEIVINNKIVAASSGTGFFVSTKGNMVTNYHVVDACDEVKAHYKGRVFDSDVLFTDRANDLAIIKANINPNKVFAVSNEDVSLLEDIIVAGYPLGKKISASIKTSKGSVTALAGYGDNYSNFQIDAALNSGNSGGPIMDQRGNIVGVAVAKLIQEGVEGFNFGVKSSTLKTFASSNQIKFEPASTEELSNKELGQLITEATIYLECWMSVAKIKQMIKEGERQKAFFSEYK